MSLTILLVPIISAFIGWFTNWIAIKMLFHPKKPITILGITFQGIFPKRQKQFAKKLGKLVSAELISFQEIEAKISNPDNVKKLMPLVESHIEHFLRVKLAEQMPVISMFIGDKTIQQLKDVFITELQELFPIIMHKYMHQLQNELDLEQIVIEKVSNFSTDKLENILKGIMSQEFRFIEILGGILGLLLGLIQVFIVYLQNN